MKPPMPAPGGGGLQAAMEPPAQPMPEAGMQPPPVPQDAPASQDEMAPGAELMQDAADMAEYNRIYAYSLMLLYDKSFMPMAVEALRNADPIEATVAQIAVAIGMRLVDAAEEQGTQINTNVLGMGGAQLIYEIAELSERKAGRRLTKEEMESAFLLATEQAEKAFGDRIVSADGPDAQHPIVPEMVEEVQRRNQMSLLPKSARPQAAQSAAPPPSGGMMP